MGGDHLYALLGQRWSHHWIGVKRRCAALMVLPLATGRDTSSGRRAGVCTSSVHLAAHSPHCRERWANCGAERSPQTDRLRSTLETLVVAEAMLPEVEDRRARAHQVDAEHEEECLPHRPDERVAAELFLKGE